MYVRLFAASWLLFCAVLAVIGSGVRRSKLLLPGRLLAGLPRAELVEGLAH